MSSPNWGYKLITCEVLNLFNVLLQFYITDRFLGGLFWDLGIQVWDEDWTGDMDVLDTVFPKMTKCNFYKYGASGSIQKHDTLCVMALNVINEKVYVFLWYWFVILFAVSVLALLWRAITICYHAKSTAFNRLVYSTLDRKLNPWDDIVIVTERFSLSDWLFLYYISANIEPFVFRSIIRQLAEEMRTPTTTSESDEQNFGSGKYSKIADPDAKDQLLPRNDEPVKRPRNGNDQFNIDTVDAPSQFEVDDTAVLTPPNPVKHVKFS